ncbi:addiction module antidote protein [Alloalcanivorax xenomutans]
MCHERPRCLRFPWSETLFRFRAFQPFDLARHLDSEATIAEYLSQVLASGDHNELIDAIGHVARAKGMSEIARASGLGRESLYKALSPGAKPRFDTVVRVLKALGVELRISV